MSSHSENVAFTTWTSNPHLQHRADPLRKNHRSPSLCFLFTFLALSSALVITRRIFLSNISFDAVNSLGTVQRSIIVSPIAGATPSANRLPLVWTLFNGDSLWVPAKQFDDCRTTLIVENSDTTGAFEGVAYSARAVTHTATQHGVVAWVSQTDPTRLHITSVDLSRVSPFVDPDGSACGNTVVSQAVSPSEPDAHTLSILSVASIHDTWVAVCLNVFDASVERYRLRIQLWSYGGDVRRASNDVGARFSYAMTLTPTSELSTTRYSQCNLQSFLSNPNELVLSFSTRMEEVVYPYVTSPSSTWSPGHSRSSLVRLTLDSSVRGLRRTFTPDLSDILPNIPFLSNIVGFPSQQQQYVYYAMSSSCSDGGNTVRIMRMNLQGMRDILVDVSSRHSCPQSITLFTSELLGSSILTMMLTSRGEIDLFVCVILPENILFTLETGCLHRWSGSVPKPIDMMALDAFVEPSAPGDPTSNTYLEVHMLLEDGSATSVGISMTSLLDDFAVLNSLRINTGGSSPPLTYQTVVSSERFPSWRVDRSGSAPPLPLNMYANPSMDGSVRCNLWFVEEGTSSHPILHVLPCARPVGTLEVDNLGVRMQGGASFDDALSRRDTASAANLRLHLNGRLMLRKIRKDRPSGRERPKY